MKRTAPASHFLFSSALVQYPTYRPLTLTIFRLYGSQPFTAGQSEGSGGRTLAQAFQENNMKDRKKNKADPYRSISVSASVSMFNDGVVMVAGAETPASVGVQIWTPVSKQEFTWGTNSGERCTNKASRSSRIQTPIFSALEVLSTPIYLHSFRRGQCIPGSDPQKVACHLRLAMVRGHEERLIPIVPFECLL